MKEAFAVETIPSQTALEALEQVLRNAGCSLPNRDTLDQRIVNDVKNGTGTIIDVQGNYPHGTAFELTEKAWPFLKNNPAPIDTDKDGMPDAWEKSKGLNAADSRDAQSNTLDRHYTNIEVYINSLVK